MGVLYEMCGHGLVSDMVLTARVLDAQEALAHGIVSRVVAPDELDSTAREMADRIAASPAVTVKLARRVISRLSRPPLRSSMEDELIYQTFLNKSEDFAEFKPARAEGREPENRGIVMRTTTKDLPGAVWRRRLGEGVLPPPGRRGCRGSPGLLRRRRSGLPAHCLAGLPVVARGCLAAGRSGPRHCRRAPLDGTAVLNHRARHRSWGKGIAVEFARLGASIVIASRKQENLDAGRAAIEELGAPVETVVCDIRDPDSITSMVDAACAAFGLPAVCVNNAAANFPVPAEDMSPNAWRTVVDITLNGTFFVAREFARRHLAANTPASIINIGASYAWTGGPGFAHSAAAKAGVKNMVESLAVEWGPYGIQVNGLVPGLIPHEDMTADIAANLQRADPKKEPAPTSMRVAPPRSSVGRRLSGQPYARFILGPNKLVVEKAPTWQRRLL